MTGCIRPNGTQSWKQFVRSRGWRDNESPLLQYAQKKFLTLQKSLFPVDIEPQRMGQGRNILAMHEKE